MNKGYTMLKITSTLLALAMATSGAFGADPPGEKPKEKTPAEVAYEKLLADNTKQAEAAYVAYEKALAAANQKILAGLEATIKDLNDMKKFPKLDIAARAKAIEEVKAKIEEVRKGAVGEVIVKRQEVAGDLLGSGGPDLAKVIVGKTLMWRDKFPTLLKEDGNTVNSFNEPWKWSIRGRNLILAVGNTSTKEYVFVNQGNDRHFVCENFGTLKF
jgi:hypothetical protein